MPCSNHQPSPFTRTPLLQLLFYSFCLALVGCFGLVLGRCHVFNSVLLSILWFEIGHFTLDFRVKLYVGHINRIYQGQFSWVVLILKVIEWSSFDPMLDMDSSPSPC